MKTPTFLFVLAIVISTFFNAIHADESQDLSASATRRGPSRFLSHKKPAPYVPIGSYGAPRAHVTCDKFPRVCHVKGSPGHDCCKKKCVNVKTDNLNCGMCGLKCRYHEVCCNGRCVNPLYDRKNCGACHNKCKRGSVCYNGMCSYA